jgi:rfaE bifunctional protein kinase chain/domain
MHAKAFGARVDFYSVVGEDAGAEWVKAQLQGAQVNTYLFSDDSRPTTNKKRYRSHQKTLLRVNEYRSHSLAPDLSQQIAHQFANMAREYDVVIFSDFSYGLLHSDLVDQLQDIARQHQIMVVADSQTSSQRGDLSKFRDVALVTPTEIEARLATDIMDNDVGLAVVIEEVGQQLGSQYVLLTLGAEGALLLDRSDPETVHLDSLSALNKQPVDVAGAGDLTLVTTSLMLRSGADLWEASLSGMVASAIHVSCEGNRPIEIGTLKQYLEQI